MPGSMGEYMPMPGIRPDRMAEGMRDRMSEKMPN